jgi:glycine cleavage system H lipoate-binding protein
MAAGLVNYKLCDRDFDCDHCPLDAALRGDSWQMVSWEVRTPARLPADRFPADRLYSTGHLWVQMPESRGGTARIGLDSFAASLLGRLIEVRVPPGPRDDRLTAELRLDSGPLTLTLPLRVETTEPNTALHERPDLALTDPYSEGWLLAAGGMAAVALDEFLNAEQALEQAQRDLRMFRRHVALEMLAETTDLGRCMADGGEPLTDLRQILGAARLHSLLRKLLH